MNMKKDIKALDGPILIIGASGLVGKNIYKLLRKNFKPENISLYGSQRSANKVIKDNKIKLYSRKKTSRYSR